MKTQTIKLNKIPEGLISLIKTTDNIDIEYHKYAVREIFIFKNRYRINTKNGQYRADGNEEIVIYF